MSEQQKWVDVLKSDGYKPGFVRVTAEQLPANGALVLALAKLREQDEAKRWQASKS